MDIHCKVDLLIPTKAKEPSVIITVWKVSVYMTAFRPPEGVKIGLVHSEKHVFRYTPFCQYYKSQMFSDDR